MAPPTMKPRIAHIDPDALALYCVESLARHAVNTLHALFGAGMAPPIDVGAEKMAELARSPCSDVGAAARELTLYAQGRTQLGAPVQEYLISLVPLWSAAIGDAPVEDFSSTGDPDTELGCVMRAAQAREDIESGIATVTPSQLAVLASVTDQQIRQLIRAGELDATEEGRTWAIAPTVARRWLASRGVPGFGRRKP